MKPVKSKKTVRVYDPINHELSYRFLDWADDAACKGQPIDTFFLSQGDNKVAVEKARVICRACKVQPDCKEFALANKVVGGIWAGLTTAERRCIIRERTRGKGKL